MKRKLIIGAIYLSGCVCSYLIMRDNIVNKFGTYDKRDRKMCMALASTSWFGVLVSGAMWIAQEDETPAKW